ncbi:MAG TPA: DUF4384 domain-containing protein, partial [Thermoguttaceae bacterium]|nr:DUF4384 domain-containing protein [Thermoguttaceae bacterium]
NYPVFAYQVRYEPDSASAQQLVQMVLWMADNAAPDYVGLKLRRHTYTFTVALREGRVRVGSGRWVGLSEQDHPDFAWYPLIPKAENPEVDYAQVKKLLGFSPEGSPPSDAPPPSEAPSAPTDRPMPMPKPQASAPPEPKPPASQHQPSAPPEPKPPASQHQPSPGPGASTSPQGIQPQGSRPSQPSPPAPASQTPPAPPSAFPQAHPSVVLSPSELVALVGQRTSSFGLDITIDRFDGAHYDPGETFSIRGVSAQAGYLYLLHLDSQGQLTLLYPLPGQDNRIQAQTPFTIPGPGDRFAFRALPPAGLNRIKAIVTSRPLVLTGLQPPPPPAQRGGSSPPDWPRQTFRWHPTQRQQLQVYLDHYHRHRQLPEPFRSVDPRSLLGPFAQDEVTFYVEAAPKHFPPHPPSSPPENLPTGKPDKNPLKQKQGQSPQVSSSRPFHTP